MQLNLTSEESRELLEMISLALTIASSDTDDSDFRLKNWEALAGKIFNMGDKEPKLSGSLTNSNPHGVVSFQPDYIEKSYFMQKINDFSEQIFWSDLILRMADKALEEHLGTAEFDTLGEEEKRKMTETLEKSLWKECSTHGIDRLGFIIPLSDA